LLLLQWR